MIASAFRVFAFSSLLCLFLASGSGADDKKIDPKVGDTAPAFQARTDADTTWASADRPKPTN
jgi:hypothetical protein